MTNEEIEVVEAKHMHIAEDNNSIDIQIKTAHAFPRSIKTFKDMAMTMATADAETAESCFYVLPRGGKSIEGPSVRLAEIVGSAWGNVRYGARIIREDDKFIYAEGMAFDLERNVAMTIEVRRRITNKYGKKYPDDMIGTTANAACSIALRNAIFKVIPKAFVDPIYKAAKQAAIGDIQTLETRRSKMIDHFGKMGVDPSRIYWAMGIVGIEDVDLLKLEQLMGMATAIKDGDMHIDEAFPPVPKDGEPDKNESKPKSLTEKIKKKNEMNKKAEHKATESLHQREPGEEG